MDKAESSSTSNRCTRLIAFVAHKRSVSKCRLCRDCDRHTPGAFHPNRDIRGITLVLIQLHPELFCSHDLWHRACSPNSESERFND